MSTIQAADRPTATGLVCARGLTKRYGERLALASVDLDLAASTTTALMGPSGSGKSTLLHVVGGLLRPTTGTVVVDGHDLSRLDDDAQAAYRSSVGFVFQAFHLVDTLSVLDNVRLPGVLTGSPVQQLQSSALQLLDRVGLADRANARPNELSGGERQRVAIARALVLRPTLVLADEPSGNLDSANAAAVLSLLTELQREDNLTLIVATHDADVAAAADRLLLLRDGLIRRDLALSGSPVQRRGAIVRLVGRA